MKNYSFIIGEESSDFILNYSVSKDGDDLFVHFANGKTKKIENRFGNERKVL